MTSKLETLRSRLLAVQRELLAAAAEVNAVPSDKALQKIANLEIAIGAIESMIDDETKVQQVSTI
ncbi:hypothetical protein Snov_2905 [Ancylobacter novellus DSM 506]|uniref:Uncharacterized protein n=1 Tax=Ancylobacter novellus (strain ATCC 8093 / DSM 506 / JCM 20403 / CCM 1077 / IAM 12100 / NBRC 12443 / NCIMB 10456) TaxID=639283 RepID=D7A6J0_ANCN5|nr:hypothetical protein [Ancylobacter novellus]ADH90188.1 hypothetical protein Snov_2905 [Ancylobacter novellus DSM 506]